MTSATTWKCNLCRDSGFRTRGWKHRRCACNPAPSKERGPRAATHEGECGVCERRFSVGLMSGRLALHGFRRPGHGWGLVGACPGENRQPVEISTETLDLLRSIATKRADLMAETLERLRSPELSELKFERRRADSWNLPKTAGYSQLYEIITIPRGAAGDHREGLPAFAELLDRRIHEVQRDLLHAREVAARAERRIAAWAPAELRALERT